MKMRGERRATTLPASMGLLGLGEEMVSWGVWFCGEERGGEGG